MRLAVTETTARKMRDRYMERVNGGRAPAATLGKHDVGGSPRDRVNERPIPLFCGGLNAPPAR